MIDKEVFCKSNKGYSVKVGRFTTDMNTGEVVFRKNSPHFMEVLAGYGIQRFVESEKKEFDLLEIFRKHPQIRIDIFDRLTNDFWQSHAEDWITHFKKGNYGDGTQMFLSVKYMKHVGKFKTN